MSGHVDAFLSEYLDGDLGHDAAAEVAAHVAACDRCADRLRALRRTVRFIQANGPVDLPPDSPARSVERFDRVLMDPDATDADRTRLALDLGRRFGVLPEDGSWPSAAPP